MMIAGENEPDEGELAIRSCVETQWLDRIRTWTRSLGFEVEDVELIVQALTHSSYANEPGPKSAGCQNNERLEFLGDAVLELAMSWELYTRFSESSEGELARLRAALVCEPSLAELAREIGLGEHLLLGKSEEKSGGRQRDSMLADAFEALVGAIFIEKGYEFAREFIVKLFDAKIASYSAGEQPIDPKSRLQELLQGAELPPPVYRTIAETGPDHCKQFTVEVEWGGGEKAVGVGKSKKGAEQEAAIKALSRLEGRQLEGRQMESEREKSSTP